MQFIPVKKGRVVEKYTSRVKGFRKKKSVIDALNTLIA